MYNPTPIYRSSGRTESKVTYPSCPTDVKLYDVNLLNKSDEQLDAMLAEVKTERKHLQKLEKTILNEFNRRNHLPELPPLSFHHQRLSADNKIQMAKFLRTKQPSYDEIIRFVEDMLEAQ